MIGVLWYPIDCVFLITVLGKSASLSCSAQLCTIQTTIPRQVTFEWMGAKMRQLIAIAAATIISGSAMAADLAIRAPVVSRVATYNWTGIYLGVNGGYMWGQQDPFNVITDRFDQLSTGLNGGFVGGTMGGQVQVAHVVLGLETDLDWANVTGSAIATPAILRVSLPVTFNATTKIPWISTARMLRITGCSMRPEVLPSWVTRRT
jgi:hypothetical protein